MSCLQGASHPKVATSIIVPCLVKFWPPFEVANLCLKLHFYVFIFNLIFLVLARPMAWFFFSHVTVPNLSTVMFYYQTEMLHLGASFLGASRVIGWFGLMIGTYIYNQYLKQMKLQRILM